MGSHQAELGAGRAVPCGAGGRERETCVCLCARQGERVKRNNFDSRRQEQVSDGGTCMSFPYSLQKATSWSPGDEW